MKDNDLRKFLGVDYAVAGMDGTKVSMLSSKGMLMEILKTQKNIDSKIELLAHNLGYNFGYQFEGVVIKKKDR